MILAANQAVCSVLMPDNGTVSVQSDFKHFVHVKPDNFSAVCDWRYDPVFKFAVFWHIKKGVNAYVSVRDRNIGGVGQEVKNRTPGRSQEL